MVELCGLATQSKKRQGSFHIRIPFNPIVPDYLVVGTDYDSFSAVYSCIDILGKIKVEIGWILTREKAPSRDVVSMIFDDTY